MAEQHGARECIAVVVASSRVGKAAIQSLTDSLQSHPEEYQNVTIRAVLRDARKAEPSWEATPFIEISSGLDLSKRETLAQVFLGVTKALIVAPQLENRDEIVNQLLTAAKEQGVRHVALIGGVFQEEERFLFHRQWMSSRRKAEELGLPWTQLECSDFMENILGSCSFIKAQCQMCGCFPEGISSPVALKDIGKAAAAVLLEKSDDHHNKAYHIVGPEALTPVQVAKVLADVTANSVEFVEVGIEESKRRALASGRASWQVEGMADWQALYFALQRLKGVASDLPKLGITPTYLREWVLENLSKFTHHRVASTPGMA